MRFIIELDNFLAMNMDTRAVEAKMELVKRELVIYSSPNHFCNMLETFGRSIKVKQNEDTPDDEEMEHLQQKNAPKECKVKVIASSKR